MSSLKAIFNSNKKLWIGISSAVVLVAVAVSTWFYIKNNDEAYRNVDPAFGKYISAYTAGTISAESTIRIRLANPIDSIKQINVPIKTELFDFSPSIKGTTVWIDNQTVEFRPEKALPQGTVYNTQFFLCKVLKVPSDFETFKFQFSVIPQSFSVDISGLKTYDKYKLTRQRLLGTIFTADVIKDIEIEKVLDAKQESHKLKISWTHEADRKTHHFQIDSIIRGKQASKVELKWSGKTIGISNSEGSETINVPSISDFSLVEAKVVQSPEQYLILQFSDPLEEAQNLDGLVRIEGAGSLRFSIEENEIHVFPSTRLSGSVNVTIDAGVKNIFGKPLKEATTVSVVFEEIKPAVKLIGKGCILPSSNGLIFPFEAVSLKAVDLKIIKIYENNVGQFLQVNELGGEYQMARVGRVILKKKMRLTSDKPVDYGRWNRFHFDLSELIKAEPGAIYRVVIGFQQSYSTYKCGDSTSVAEDENLVELGNPEDEEEYGIDDPDEGYYGGYDEEYYDYGDEGYNWEEREDPCKGSYYSNDKNVSRNILASDLGIIAKRGSDGSLVFAVTNLLTTNPESGVTLEIRDYQHQVLATLTTDAEGLANVKLKRTPFLLVARKGQQRGYLKLADGASLSLSMFDVSGEKVQKGLKGFIYGDRGVWRPGDSLYLTFILDDKEKTLPELHPVMFELLNPMGQIVKRIVKTSSVNGFYDFRTATDSKAPTGNWSAKVKVGGAEFYQKIKIETVMPNRLKLNLDLGAELLTQADKDKTVMLNARWLHGAIAKNLKAKVEVLLTTGKTSFKQYPQYNFDDPAGSFNSESQTLLEGQLNENGQVPMKVSIAVGDAAPGMLRANFTCRVFEEGGNSSVDRFGVPYSPFKNYLGVKVQGQERPGEMIFTDTTNVVNIVSVDEQGKPVSLEGLEVKIYKIDWRWWWDHSDESLSNYVSSESHTPMVSETISTKNGSAKWKFRINAPNYGRFYIRVTNPDGHSTGQIVYMSNPRWYSNYDNGIPGAASMLSFSSDKEKYKVGDKVKLTMPSSPNGRALISIESGTKVLKTYWTETKEKQTVFEFPVTADMAPNVFINVSMIQPHAQTLNDLPIRLYGIVGISVEDPATHLSPQIAMPQVLRPESDGSITVSESSGKPMTYTIAIVDEGLLDLTRFKTPDVWNSFYAKQALGVKSWDMYDDVMGAFGGKLERILSIGGDEDLRAKGSKAIRFKPMVLFMGPFKLKAGQSSTHKFRIPQYIGSVRAMVVAGENGAYGNAEKTVAVRKPLMVLATLPRVMGPGEKVSLPVNIFAMENHVKKVSVKVTTNHLFTLNGESTKTINFDHPGDDVIYFDLKANSLIGVGRVKVVAKSGSETATFDVELDVRNPNPRVFTIHEGIVEAGKSWEKDYVPVGISGTNKGVLEVSSLPPINLGERLDYLIQYPHGCIEQTTSSGFPQLYLSDLMTLPAQRVKEIESNIKATINRLKSFQLASGAMSYWPGENYECEWGANYAGHFMVEAEKRGYSLPYGFMDGWKRYQKMKAQAWTSRQEEYHYDLTQAYRLYTLALANAPELGAMNRLREYKNLSNEARWRLAAAYQIVGQAEVARQLIAKASTAVNPYSELSYTFGSGERDAAMILETMTIMGEKVKAAVLVRQVAASLSSNRWMSTQSTAYCLLAIGKYAHKSGITSNLRYTYTLSGAGTQNINSASPMSQIDMKLKGDAPGKISVKNTSTATLYIRSILQGIPETGDQTSAANNLTMSIVYKTRDDKVLNPVTLEQGTDFIAEVTITNPGQKGYYKEMALTQIFPSGWEIHNARMAEAADPSAASSDLRYQDIRDDRVYTYFDIGENQTKTFRILLNAAYLGRFYLPTTQVEAMYDATINARVPGKWVEVKRAGE